MVRLAMVLCLCSALSAQAQGSEPLDAAAIVAALTDRSITYDNGATQRFFASGRTQYTDAEPSWGSWRVENDQYCSNWPPARDWDCYDVHRLEDGRITFLDAWNNDFPGRIEGE